MRGAHYTNEPGTASRLVPDEAPAFRNWLSDTDNIQHALDWLAEGLEFDIEYADLWRPGWGPRPATLDARKARLRQLVAHAPRMIPVFGHRYLLAEPCRASNPVFSIYQSDIIVYGPDLRTYLLVEFGDLLGLDQRETEWAAVQGQRGHEAFYASIPFWGDLYTHNNTLLEGNE